MYWMFQERTLILLPGFSTGADTGDTNASSCVSAGWNVVA